MVKHSEKIYDIAVIGGGAGGFAAALTAAEYGHNLNIAILEGGERTGRKLAASGNGQGNIANTNLGINCYHGKNTVIAEKVFTKIPYERLIAFFEGAGIEITEKENGRVYPKSFQASSVLDCLRLKSNEKGIEEKCSFFVTRISKENEIFTLTSDGGKQVYAKAVIAACGGAASPCLSSGTGYNLLEKFGHKTGALLPSLVQLKTEKEKLKFLKGVKTDAEISVTAEGGIIKSAKGDILFTDYGISGASVFEISGAAVRALNQGKHVAASIDLLPDISYKDLVNMLNRRKNAFPNRACENFFTGFIPKQISKSIIYISRTDPLKLAENLSQNEINAFADCLKKFTLTVTGSLSLESAQVTAGGIDTSDFDGNLMSKLCKNLYACGEMLDIDGDCGGYNLMWAFASGIICGISAAKADLK